MKRMFSGFFLSLLFSAPSLAQVPPLQSGKVLYLSLIQDFYSEMKTMDQVTEPSDKRQLAVNDFATALAVDGAQEFKFENGSSWAPFWPVDRSGLEEERAKSSVVYQVKVPVVRLGSVKHSIKDLRGYVHARLGAAAAEAIESHQVVPVVIGGRESSIADVLSVRSSSLFKIPSLYESWGISKWFVPASAMSDGRSRLIFVVPPAMEYLEHYQHMLGLLTGRQELVLRVESDYQDWKKSFQQAASRALDSIGISGAARVDFVALGYFGQWPTVLKKHQELISEIDLGPVYQDKSGLLARRISFSLKRQDGVSQRVNILTLGHTKTIWGQASADLLSAFMPLYPRGVLFMGSAGGLSGKANVYDISVPQKFLIQKSNLDMKNFVSPLNLPKSEPDRTSVHFDFTHGHTPSPAAQTEDYLMNKIRSGEQSLDVEQNLVAQMIQDFNKSNKTQIRFGAINLITDKPLAHEQSDLDNVDQSRKSKSREAIVSLALRSVESLAQKPLRCQQVFF